MILCDIGNTSYHFLDGNRSYKKSVKDFNPQEISKKVYFISVNANLKEQLSSLENWIDLAEFVDMSNYYESMGIDRIFAVETIDNGVIVDAGSAITVDVVKDGVYMGGFISPGLQAMKDTYKHISCALDYEFNFDLDLNTLAKTSQDSISYGVLKPLYTEVCSYNLPIVLTGGDARSLQKIFSNSIVDEKLIFKSMKALISKKL